MKEFFHTVKFKILVCIFALLLGFLIYVAVSAGVSSLPKQILETVSAPFVTLSTNVSDWIENTLDKFVNADKYKQENEILKEQLAQAYSDVIRKENNKDFKWSPPCSVTARNASDISGGFTINRGRKDGISLYDPVFTKTGLVGIVTEVSEAYSVVSTVLSTDVYIGVTGAECHALGVIENDLKNSENGLCVMNYSGKDSGIKEGEIILTSGSEFFPEGIMLGKVKEMVGDDNGLAVHVLIEPFVDVYTVTDVFVLTDFDGKGEN